MESLLDVGETIALYVFLVWVLFLALQSSDLLATLVDMRGAHDLRIRGRATSRRVTEYFWAIPAVFTLALFFALGIDYAGHLLFDLGRERDGLTVLAVLLFVAFGAGIGIVYALSRGETASYAILRDNLTQDIGLRLTRGQVDGFRAQLDLVDAKSRRIRLGVRDRGAMPRTRAHLRETAESFRAVPPAGLQALGAIGWTYAWAYLWRGNVLRVVPPLLILADTVFVAVLVGIAGDPAGWALVALGLLGTAVSAGLAITSARASLAAKTAWHAVYLKQRSEVEDLLIELEKATRKGVTGLGDRVARALQILREQQQ